MPPQLAPGKKVSTIKNEHSDLNPFELQPQIIRKSTV
jgi:hypothetical protein